MTGHLEFSSRAALCRQLAEREPANRILWVAEAANWSRLSQDKIRDEAGESEDSRISAGLPGLRQLLGYLGEARAAR
jgi:hypothetical protein